MLWEALSLCVIAFIVMIPVNSVISGTTNASSQCTNLQNPVLPVKNSGFPSSCHCPPASRTSGEGQCYGGGICQAALPADGRLLSMIRRRISLHGYRRLYSKNLLNHEKRELIFKAIKGNPGISTDMLIQLTEINPHTLRYHTDQLVTMKIIRKKRVNGTDHYFARISEISEEAMVPLAYKNHNSTARTLQVISEKPGINRSDLASTLGISGPSVTRQLNQLILEKCVRGKSACPRRRCKPSRAPCRCWVTGS